jgi:DNA-binding PadR family transcriptional regulator
MFGPKRMKRLFGWGSRRGGHGFGPGRVFGKGDLKYVILDLLQDKPAHGYELIRALEERFRGFYSPSPGSVYPTLQLLEDMGYVSAAKQNGKKVYSITDEGRKFLEENRRSVDDIWGRADEGWDPELAAEMREMWREVGGLGRLFGGEMRAGRVDRDKLRRVRDVISRAAREIEAILEEPEGSTRL